MLGLFISNALFGIVVAGLCTCVYSCNTFSDTAAAKEKSKTGFQIQVDKNGSYNISVDNAIWLDLAPTFLRLDNRTYSSENGTLILNHVGENSGKDVIGRFLQYNFSFTTVGKPVVFDTLIKEYHDIPAMLFIQDFRNGSNWTQAPSVDGISSGFPGFHVKQAGLQLGYLSYGGTMLGDQKKKVGLWNDSSTINGGISGGPLVVFDIEGQSIIFSPFNNFMTSSLWQDAVVGGNIYGGVMGGITHIPPLYKQSFVLFYGTTINKAFDGWGNLLRMFYDKDTGKQDSDLSLNFLGYWTNEGTYYYFHTEVNKTYEETVLDIETDAKKMKIPHRYFQYGPWWYYDDVYGGVKSWKSRPDVFPDGFSMVYHELGLPSMASTKIWSNDTIYAKQNGGQYNFLLQNHTGLPLTQMFWRDLFQNASRWGLTTYQQDSMAIQMNGIDRMFHDVNFGRDWLIQVGNAASQSSISIQYGMTYPRHGLQALEIQPVTQARSTLDHLPSNWKIGITSLFAASLGLAPATSSFQTTKGVGLVQMKVHPCARDMNFNGKCVKKCCNEDGLILKPEHPVRALDKQIIKAAFTETDGPEGEAWIAYSDISGLRFANLLVLGIKNGTKFSVSQKDTGLFDHAGDSNLYSVPYDNPLGWGVFTTFNSLTFTSFCSVEKFCLYHLATAIPDWFMTVIFGEMDKWVPMSPKRVLSISWTNETVIAPLQGAANETFDFWYILGSKMDMVTCKLSSNGSAIFKMDNTLGIATC